MLKDLNQIEKIVLKGHFKRSEKTKQEEVKDMDLSKISPEAKEILDFKDQNFDFEVKILDFDSDLERFIAKGDDIFGKSVIQGVITHEGKMEFTKRYMGGSRHGLRIPRPDSIEYFGQIEISKEGVSCRGEYEIYPGSLECGKWELSSTKEST